MCFFFFFNYFLSYLFELSFSVSLFTLCHLLTMPFFPCHYFLWLLLQCYFSITRKSTRTRNLIYYSHTYSTHVERTKPACDFNLIWNSASTRMTLTVDNNIIDVVVTNGHRRDTRLVRSALPNLHAHDQSP